MAPRRFTIVAGAIVLIAVWFWLAAPRNAGVAPAQAPGPAMPSVESDRHAASSPQPSAASAALARRGGLSKIDAAQRAQLQAAIARARAAKPRPESTDGASPQAPVAAAPTQAQTFEVEASRRERIRGHINELVPLLAECYEHELAQAPGLAGRLLLRFVIDGEPGVGGIVSENEILGGELAERRELVTCVRETLFTAKFDAPEGGGSITVEYPFVFGASKQAQP